jgi:GMP synthase-like glutamine amidotransferase
VLGICFGGQLMARVLGADTWRGEVAEVGWLPVRSEEPDLVPEGPWFQWHFDTFDLPQGARLLADTPAGPQAFSYGRSLGVQFHPEVTPAIMDDWVRVYRHELEEVGVGSDELLEETRRQKASSRGRAWQLFGGWRDRIAGIRREQVVGG